MAIKVFVMAKEPVAGLVKTRLCPPLSADAAADLHAAFVTDTLERLSSGGWRPVLAASPDGAAPKLNAIAARTTAVLVWQGSGDLGCRMQRLVHDAVDAGDAAIVLGADTPDVPLAYVSAAARALERSGAVVGPSPDGGYYLIGANGACPPVFELDAEWGSAAVLGETLARLRAARVPTTVLPAWRDVDDADGLAEFLRRIGPERQDLRATCRALAAIGLAG